MKTGETERSVRSLFEGDLPWSEDPPVSIARVRSGMEGRLEQFCAARGVKSLVVRYTVERLVKDRVKVTSRSLFPGVVFLGCGDLGRTAYGDYRKTLGRREAYPRINISSASQVGLQQDLIRLARAIDQKAITGDAQKICLGTKVRVTRGPLMGMTGEVVSALGRKQFVVPVVFLGQCVPATVAAEDLEPVEAT